jgi:hypothetical protein
MEVVPSTKLTQRVARSLRIRLLRLRQTLQRDTSDLSLSCRLSHRVANRRISPRWQKGMGQTCSGDV